MQPYFLPYLGYFSLIAATDRFVVFDPVQYIRRGWVNRNRVLKPTRDEPQYIRVPVAKHGRSTTIRDMRVASDSQWKSRITAQLEHYRTVAPFYDETISVVSDCLSLETELLVELNVHCLKTICGHLDLPHDFLRFDQIDKEVKPATKPGDWALNISRALGATTYVNPPGGREIFNPTEFAAANVELLFLQNSLTEYPQANKTFVPGLSIVDVLMFCGREETRHKIEADILMLGTTDLPAKFDEPPATST